MGLGKSKTVYMILGYDQSFHSKLGSNTPLMGSYKKVKNQKHFLTYKLVWSVNYRPKARKTSLLQMQFLGMLTSQNFAGLSIIDVKLQS